MNVFRSTETFLTTPNSDWFVDVKSNAKIDFESTVGEISQTTLGTFPILTNVTSDTEALIKFSTFDEAEKQIQR